jgi:hypothetical protein
MRYAVAYKPDSEPLDQFIRRRVASTPARLGLLGVSVGERQRVREAVDGRMINDFSVVLGWKRAT